MRCMKILYGEIEQKKDKRKDAEENSFFAYETNPRLNNI